MGKDLAKQRALEWYFNPDGNKGTQKELAKELGVGKDTLIRWIKSFKEQGNGGDEALFIAQVRTRAMEARSPASILELYARLKGYLVDKSEVKVEIGLSADEHTRRNLEAERELREFRETSGHRVEEVPEKPTLLPEPVLLHPNKGTNEVKPTEND